MKVLFDFSMAQISCHITDRGQLLSLKNGQMVTVKGTVGKQTIGVIDLNDCQIIQNCMPYDESCRRKQRQALLHWAYDSRKI